MRIWRLDDATSSTATLRILLVPREVRGRVLVRDLSDAEVLLASQVGEPHPYVDLVGGPLTVLFNRSGSDSCAMATDVLAERVDPRTPLQVFMSAPATPIFRPRWDGGGRFELELEAERTEDFAAELATAGVADVAWLEYGELRGRALVVGSSLVLPDDFVLRALAARYGEEAAAALSPSRADWMSLLTGTRLCVLTTYERSDDLLPLEPSRPPDCQALADLATGIEIPAPTVVVRRATWRSAGSQLEPEHWQDVTLGDGDLLVASVGDQFDVRSGDWVVCRGSECGRSGVLDAPGVAEVRWAPEDAAPTLQSLTFARIVIVDTALDLHLSELGGGGEATVAELARHADGRIAIRRRATRVAGVLVLTPTAASLLGTGSVYEVALPPARLAEPVRTDARFALWAGEGTRCPAERSETVDPETLAPDRELELFLVELGASGEAVRCLARLPARIALPRVLASAWPVELRTLGEIHAFFLLSEPFGFGLAASLLAVELHVAPFARVELALDVTLATSFVGGLTRSGVGVHAVLLLGIDEAPALVCAGALLEVAHHNGTEIPLTPVVGVDLASLLDLGGLW